MKTLQKGDIAPNFTSVDEEGNKIQFLDYKGKKLIVFFYPKASTPGCIAEACNLRDHYKELQDNGYNLLGVSADSPKRQSNFKNKYKFPFPLLQTNLKKSSMLLEFGGQKSLWVKNTMVFTVKLLLLMKTDL